MILSRTFSAVICLLFMLALQPDAAAQFKLLHSIESTTIPFVDCAFDETGQHVITVGGDESLEVTWWSIATGIAIRKKIIDVKLPNVQHPPVFIDSRYLVVKGDYPPSFLVYDLKLDKELLKSDLPTSHPMFAKEHSVLAWLGVDENKYRKQQQRENSRRQRLGGGGTNAREFGGGSNQPTLKPVLYVMKLDTGEMIKSKVLEPGHFMQTAISADGKMLASFSDDQILRIWETATATEVSELKDGDSGKALDLSSNNSKTMDYLGITSIVQFSPDGKYVLALLPGKAKLWDLKNGTSTELPDATGPIQLTSDSKNVVFQELGRSSSTVCIWNIETNVVTKVLDHELTEVINKFGVLKDVSKIVGASIGEPPHLLVWDVLSGKKLGALQGDWARTIQLVTSNDEKYCASVHLAEKNGKLVSSLKIWRLPD